MLDYITSITLNKYWDDNNIQLSDFQRAILIINAEIPISQKEDELISILEATEDDILKSKLSTLIREYTNLFETFKESDENSVFVVTEIVDNEFSDVFNNYEAAEKYGLNMAYGKFNITKKRVFNSVEERSEWEDVNWCTIDGVCRFNDRHELMSFEPELESLDRKCLNFAISYIKLPHPFRKGDLVEYYGDIGVVHEAPKDEVEYEEWLKAEPDEMSDISDLQLTSYFYDSNSGTIYHAHPMPWELEKIDAEDVDNRILHLCR